MNTTTRDEHGSVAVAMLFSISLTCAAAIGLVLDGGAVHRSQRHAEAVAFQAARAGAQALDTNELANGQPHLDPQRARAIATRAAQQLLDADASTHGTIRSITADATHVDVIIEQTTNLTAAALFGKSKATVTGHATVRVAAGVSNEGS